MTAKLFILSADIGHGAAYWASVCRSVGAEISYAATKHVLPLSDESVQRVAAMAGFNYMSSDTLHMVTDRVGQQQLGIPVMPAVRPVTEADLHSFGDTPLFTKRSTTYRKGRDTLDYQRWASPAEVPLSILGTDYVIQPALPEPTYTLYFSMAVSESGEACIPHAFRMASNGSMNSSFVSTAVPDGLAAQYTALCQQIGIYGGIHDIELAWYEGQWKLLDWNCRPGYNVSQGRNNGTLVNEALLSHMLGLPAVEVPASFVEQRRYLDKGYGTAFAAKARALGMFVVMQGTIVRSVDYCAPTVAEVAAKFAELES